MALDIISKMHRYLCGVRLLVRRIRPGTDAYLAGIGQGDILTHLNGKAINKEELEAAIEAAKRESLSAFGEDELIVENWLIQ